MDQFFRGGSDTILLLIIGGLSWFFRYKLAQYDDAHKAIKSDDEILSLIGEKYVSRVEQALINEQRKELREQLMQRLDRLEADIAILRGRNG